MRESASAHEIKRVHKMEPCPRGGSIVIRYVLKVISRAETGVDREVGRRYKLEGGNKFKEDVYRRVMRHPCDPKTAPDCNGCVVVGPGIDASADAIVERESLGRLNRVERMPEVIHMEVNPASAVIDVTPAETVAPE